MIEKRFTDKKYLPNGQRYALLDAYFHRNDSVQAYSVTKPTLRALTKKGLVVEGSWVELTPKGVKLAEDIIYG